MKKKVSWAVLLIEAIKANMLSVTSFKTNYNHNNSVFALQKT